MGIANPAGMVLIWNARQKSGKGADLSFDFDRLHALSPKDTPKAAIKHLDKPDQIVSTAAEFDLNANLYQNIILAGSKPYKLLRITRLKHFLLVLLCFFLVFLCRNIIQGHRRRVILFLFAWA